jgi:hypothetical protein
VCVMDTGSEKNVAVLSQMADDSDTHMKPAGRWQRNVVQSSLRSQLVGW